MPEAQEQYFGCPAFAWRTNRAARRCVEKVSSTHCIRMQVTKLLCTPTRSCWRSKSMKR